MTFFLLQIYLSQYGYLSPSVRDPSKSQFMSEDSVSKAIMEFQAFAGINTTGKDEKRRIHED